MIPFKDRYPQRDEIKDKLNLGTAVFIYANDLSGVSAFAENIKEGMKNAILLERKKNTDSRLKDHYDIRDRLISIICNLIAEKGEENYSQTDIALLKYYFSLKPTSKYAEELEKLTYKGKPYLDTESAINDYFDNNNSIIIVDDANDIPRSQIDFLKKLVHRKVVGLVLILKKGNGCDIFEGFLKGNNESMEFPSPNKELVDALFEGVDISEEQRNKLNNCNNIYRLIDILNKKKGSTLKYEKIQIEILKILKACDGQYENNVIKITDASPLGQVIKIDDPENHLLKIAESIDNLVKREILRRDEDNRIWIKRPYETLGIEFTSQDFLKYRMKVEEYLSSKHPDLKYYEYVQLYGVLKQLGSNDKYRTKLFNECARRIVCHKLVSKYKIEGEEDGDLIGDCNLWADKSYELMTIIYFLKADYSEAVYALERLKKTERFNKIERGGDKSYSRLSAALLNRTYKLQESVEEFNMLIDAEKDSFICNLLISYLIGSYIHLEKPEGAKTLRSKAKEDHPSIGYVYRNLASALLAEEREQWYKRAFDAFEKGGDEYGKNTVMCAWGYSQTVKTDPNFTDGLIKIREALDWFKGYGEQNDEFIASNNMGINVLLSSNDPMEAVDYFDYSLGKTSVQRLFSRINLSHCYIALGPPGLTKAKIELNGVENDIMACESELKELRRVNQQYYAARALLAYYEGNEEELFDYMKKCEGVGNRYEQKKLDNNLKTYEDYLKKMKKMKAVLTEKDYYREKEMVKNSIRWKEFYIPSGLFHWYSSPIDLLSKEEFGNIISKYT